MNSTTTYSIWFKVEKFPNLVIKYTHIDDELKAKFYFVFGLHNAKKTVLLKKILSLFS